MNQSFFSRFHPKIIDVVYRDETFWNFLREPSNIFNRSKTNIRNFIVVQKGKGTLVINGEETYELSRGMIVYFPYQSQVSLRMSSEDPLCFYSVHYDYALVNWDGTSITCQTPAEKNLPFPNGMKLLDASHFIFQMKAMLDVWREKNVDYEWKCKLAFLNILHDVQAVQADQYEDHVAQRSVQKCMEYIKHHYDKPIEREELARIASLSASYFSTIFKKVTGYTPTQYITKVRIDNAKHYLQTSDMTISEVARTVGFQDPLYFGKVFASHTGLPPREYRKA